MNQPASGDAGAGIAFMLMGVVLLGGAAWCFIVCALHRAPASVVSPTGCAELIAAAASGYAIFGDIPERYTWLGAAPIVGSGLVVACRESAWRKRYASNRRSGVAAKRPSVPPGDDHESA